MRVVRNLQTHNRIFSGKGSYDLLSSYDSWCVPSTGSMFTIVGMDGLGETPAHQTEMAEKNAVIYVDGHLLGCGRSHNPVLWQARCSKERRQISM